MVASAFATTPLSSFLEIVYRAPPPVMDSNATSMSTPRSIWSSSCPVICAAMAATPASIAIQVILRSDVCCPVVNLII